MQNFGENSPKTSTAVETQLSADERNFEGAAGDRRNFFADQGEAIIAMLEYGATVFIDESQHTMIDRGYAAIVSSGEIDVVMHLVRVETHYEWKWRG
jgi:hypothetical protein